jgi:hypothetical protein
MTGLQIQEEAYRAFDVWLAAQLDEMQELDILEQINLYAASTQVEAANYNEAGRAAA